MSAPESVIALLRARGLTIATAESLTAGLLASTLAGVPGCSAVLRGGVVAYASDVKHSLLGIDERLLEHVVSEKVAVAMAMGAARVLASDIGVGTTGVAGPERLDGQRAGTVWVAVHDARAGTSQAQCLDIAGDRDEVRRGSVDACLIQIEEMVRASAR